MCIERENTRKLLEAERALGFLLPETDGVIANIENILGECLKNDLKELYHTFCPRRVDYGTVVDAESLLGLLDQPYFGYPAKYKLLPISSFYSEDWAFIDNRDGRIHVFDITCFPVDDEEEEAGFSAAREDLLKMAEDTYDDIWSFFSHRYIQMYYSGSS